MHRNKKQKSERRRDRADSAKRFRERSRETVFQHYGGKCACCGERNYKFLTIDHINNDGSTRHIRKSGQRLGGQDLYPVLIREGFPKDIQLLCWNCNSGRAANGGICPHKEEQVKQWLVTILVILGAVVIITGLLYYGSTYLSIELTRAIAIALLWLWPVSVGLSYYFGRVEVRGFLHGADKIADSVLGRSIDAIERRKKAETPPIIQVLPQDTNSFPSELMMERNAQTVFDYPDDLPRLPR